MFTYRKNLINYEDVNFDIEHSYGERDEELQSKIFDLVHKAKTPHHTELVVPVGVPLRKALQVIGFIESGCINMKNFSQTRCHPYPNFCVPVFAMDVSED